VMASLLPTASHTSAASRERAQAVVLPTIQIIAERN
jgi:hypothetical protein